MVDGKRFLPRKGGSESVISRTAGSRKSGSVPTGVNRLQLPTSSHTYEKDPNISDRQENKFHKPGTRIEAGTVAPGEPPSRHGTAPRKCVSRTPLPSGVKTLPVSPGGEDPDLSRLRHGISRVLSRDRNTACLFSSHHSMQAMDWEMRSRNSTNHRKARRKTA